MNKYNNIWGEHEIDYILFIKKDVEFDINKNEIADVQYVSQDKLKSLLKEYKENDIKVSPWFNLITDNFLYNWWDNLDNIIKNKGLNDSNVTDTIHRLL